MKPQVVAYRGEIPESVHNIHYVVVDRLGREIASGGNGDLVTYWRSAAKPIQLLPLVEGGGVEQFGLEDRHLAVMASSHNGEKVHVEAVAQILERIGMPEDALACGVHPPWYDDAALELARRGEEPRAIHNNCSGKHANMLALCRLYGWDPEGYYKKEHPVQRRIMEEIRSFTGLTEEQLVVGTDGCGVPVFGLPLRRMAWAYALLADPRDLPRKKGEAARRITKAMAGCPMLVAGTGRLDTELMEAGSGEIVAKLGSEAVYCLALLERGWGVALKVEDGSLRALGPAVMALLAKFDILTDALPQQRKVVLHNHRGEVIGHLAARGID
ncbi:MAG: asparaginase [Limnochordia bacterium]